MASRFIEVYPLFLSKTALLQPQLPRLPLPTARRADERVLQAPVPGSTHREVGGIPRRCPPPPQLGSHHLCFPPPVRSQEDEIKPFHGYSLGDTLPQQVRSLSTQESCPS